MLNLLSILYLLMFVASGLVVANAVFPREAPLVRLYLGLVAGLLFLLWLPAAFSFLFRTFSVLTQLLALFIALGLGCFCYKKAGLPRYVNIPRQDLVYALLATLPLFLVSAYLLSTHTIEPINGALYAGQSTYGDLAMHLGFITSITRQGAFPPNYSICPDTPIGYPFLSDSVSSTFYTLGASLRLATMLPALLALLIVFFGVYTFFRAWLKEKKAALFASYLFSLGGGFGFWYFLDVAKLEPGKLTKMLSAFYETPTNFVEKGLRWVNPIADMLIPQRATLFGWALLFGCLYLLYRAVFEEETRLFYPLGVLAGLLPLVHTHSFLALGILSGAYLFICAARGKIGILRPFLHYGLIAIGLALPQLIAFTFRQSGGFLHLHWNWANIADSFLWFYIKNWGLIFLLLPTAFLMLEGRDRLVYSGALLIWLLVETIQFQPNTYDNNKLLFITYALSCGLVAKWLCRMGERLSAGGLSNRIGMTILAVPLLAALFLSGTLTLLRESVSHYELIPRTEVEACAFIEENTPTNATFLTHNNHNNSVAVLTGRNIVCGSGTFLFFHGINYRAREEALKLLYEEPSLYYAALDKKYTIDYVFVGGHERYNYAIDYAYFDLNFDRVYDEGGVCIYQERNSMN